MAPAPLQPIPGAASLIDVLDRVIDKGIRIGPPPRASSISIDLVKPKARVIIADAEVHLAHCGLTRANMAVEPSTRAEAAARPSSLTESLDADHLTEAVFSRRSKSVSRRDLPRR